MFTTYADFALRAAQPSIYKKCIAACKRFLKKGGFEAAHTSGAWKHEVTVTLDAENTFLITLIEDDARAGVNVTIYWYGGYSTPGPLGMRNLVKDFMVPLQKAMVKALPKKDYDTPPPKGDSTVYHFSIYSVTSADYAEMVQDYLNLELGLNLKFKVMTRDGFESQKLDFRGTVFERAGENGTFKLVWKNNMYYGHLWIHGNKYHYDLGRVDLPPEGGVKVKLESWVK